MTAALFPQVTVGPFPVELVLADRPGAGDRPAGQPCVGAEALDDRGAIGDGQDGAVGLDGDRGALARPTAASDHTAVRSQRVDELVNRVVGHERGVVAAHVDRGAVEGHVHLPDARSLRRADVQEPLQ